MRADPGAPAPAAALPAEALTRCGCNRDASWHAREAVLSSVFELHASPAVARHNALVAPLAAGRHRQPAALLGELVDGNRSAHHALTGVRYPGLPLDVFERLHTVGGAERR
ncbi:hypothetical protein [Kitasatospora purpeofusca]|uniref:hypothetical protein n=1 Tax=Kitasatospora purpeofusca TaxID=67352 RepID=UPI002257C81F|nr:hypothetical protein [Kitasatospora purpeofusca]MCX4752154.1 hypothetical protein [Kitasatospora purpeofusca]WSR31750.1 hypothetical protein OG715_12650 [Kitasatospora purpeofusca]